MRPPISPIKIPSSHSHKKNPTNRHTMSIHKKLKKKSCSSRHNFNSPEVKRIQQVNTQLHYIINQNNENQHTTSTHHKPTYNVITSSTKRMKTNTQRHYIMNQKKNIKIKTNTQRQNTKRKSSKLTHNIMNQKNENQHTTSITKNQKKKNPAIHTQCH